MVRIIYTIIIIILSEHVHDLCTVPGVVQNLTCTMSSISSVAPSMLSLLWELPATFQNEIVGYQVAVKGLQHRSGTREVIQFEVYSFNTTTRAATLNQGLGIMIIASCIVQYRPIYTILCCVVPEVPYNITVRALSLAGCSQEQQHYCFIQEGRMIMLYLV